MQANPLTKAEKVIALLLCFTTAFVYLFNLGELPLLADEGIRGTVAFEMGIRENLIVPTVAGEYYYKKPPLYNWIMLFFFWVSGSYSEFMLRLPAVLSLFGFGTLIWWVCKREISSRVGIISAFAFLLCGRMLIYDSYLGHIDIFYSWVTFAAFYCLYHFSKKKEWTALFISTYFLTACGVLMKGLPSFLFQGFSIVAWLFYCKEWKKLFSFQHVIGLLVFIAVVGGYFGAYAQYNSLENYFFYLYDQASQRTVVEKAWYEGVLNIFTFPIGNLGHLFPTSVLVVYLFQKGLVSSWLRQRGFLSFVILIFVVNIPPYWLSPGYYPRYLFMLYPLFFIAAAAAWEKREDKSWRDTIFNALFIAFFIVLIIGSFIPVFYEAIQRIPHYFLKSALLLLFASTGLFAFLKWKEYRILLAFFALIIARLGFNYFVIPYRSQAIPENAYAMQRMHCKEISALTADKPLYILNNSGYTEEMTYYLGTMRNTVIQKVKEPVSENAYYIVYPKQVEKIDHKVIYEFNLRWKNRKMFVVEL